MDNSNKGNTSVKSGGLGGSLFLCLKVGSVG